MIAADIFSVTGKVNPLALKSVSNAACTDKLPVTGPTMRLPSMVSLKRAT